MYLRSGVPGLAAAVLGWCEAVDSAAARSWAAETFQVAAPDVLALAWRYTTSAERREAQEHQRNWELFH